MVFDLVAELIPSIGRIVIGLLITIVVIEVLLRTTARFLKRYGGGIAGVRRLAYAAAAVFILIPFAREVFPDPAVAYYGGIGAVLAISFLGYRIFNRVLTNIAQWMRDAAGQEFYTGVFIPIRKIGNAVVLIVIFLAVIGASGIDLGPLLFGWGFALFIFALAIQGILGDVVAGLYILITRSFRVGDIVQFSSGEVCEVLDIKDQRTVLKNLVTNEIINQPNLDLLKARLIRLNGRETEIGIPIKVKATSSRDLEKTKNILLKLSSEAPQTSSQPAAKVYLVELSSEGAKYEVRLSLKDAKYSRETTDWFNTNLLRAFETEDIHLG